METINIGYGHMVLGFLLLIIPTYFLYRYRTGLVKDTLWAALRMTVQLFFIGFYLEYLFLWDNLWINLLWVVLMIVIASSTVLKRTKLPQKMLFMAVAVAFLVSLLIIDLYFLGLVVRPEKIFTARYFIPISGMILGNMLSANVIALNSFYGSLNRERQLYLYLLGNGATPGEGTRPLHARGPHQVVQPHHRLDGGHGTHRPARHHDGSDTGRQQPQRGHQISDYADDYHLRLVAHIGTAHAVDFAAQDLRPLRHEAILKRRILAVPFQPALKASGLSLRMSSSGNSMAARSG